MTKRQDTDTKPGEQGGLIKTAEPCEAEATPEGVRIEGPNHIEVVIDPAAALETARNIGEAAVDAIITNAVGPKKRH